MNKDQILQEVTNKFGAEFPNNSAEILVKERTYSKDYEGQKRPYIAVIKTDLNSIDLNAFKTWCFKVKNNYYSVIFPNKVN